MRAFQNKYIAMQNKKINLLKTENAALERENAMLKQSIARYKEAAQKVQALESEYIEGIKQANDLKDQCNHIIAECRLAQSKYTKQAQALLANLRKDAN